MATSTTPWDAPYCVDRFKKEAGLQDANEMNDETDICPALSRAQVAVAHLIAQRYPKALYQAPRALIASADRKTFRFGNDPQGNPTVPLGYVQIATSMRAFSGDARFCGWREDDDFLDEGDHIRIPSDRSYGGTLYGRWVPTPPDISITYLQDPVLNPADARELIVIEAVKEWAGEGNQLPALVDRMKDKWADKFPRHMLTYKKRYRAGGGFVDSARWYTASRDLGTSGS